MKLFKKPDQDQNRRHPRQQPGERMRDPQRRLPSAGQNKTFSYYASRSQTEFNLGREAVQSKAPLRRVPSKLQRLRRHAGWLVAGVLGVGLFVYQLQLSTSPKVVSLADSSDVPFLKDGQTYARAAQQLFKSTAANRNKLTVDSNGIAAELQRQFPELETVSVSLPLIGSQPTVVVLPAAPALVLAARNGTFVVDENGRALAEVDAGSNLASLHIPTVTDQSDNDVKLGEQVLPRSATNFVQTVGQQFAAQKLTVQSMTLPAAASELDVYVANEPYYVKFNLRQTGKDAAALQTGTFIAAIKKLGREGIKPSQYVDVRLDGRAYYK